MRQDPTHSFKKEMLAFTWETITHNQSALCIGISIDGDYIVGVEEVMENFWKWDVHKKHEWIMDSNNYPNGTCQNKKDAITMAINIATIHYDKNFKTNWK